MLSLLSSRLEVGRNTPSNTSSDSYNPISMIPSSISAGGHSSSVGGYSADREGTGSLPGHIDFHVKRKRNYTSDSGGRAKRNKLNAEQQYAAKVAKADIARAGLAIPVLRATSRGPRAISLGKMDTTNFKLVFAQEVAASPFLIPTTLERSSTETNHNFTTNVENVYIEMLDSCRNAYCGVDDEASDSTSSFSDTVSDDLFTSSKSLALNPRIDDTLATGEPVTRLPSLTAQAVSYPPALSMTMEEALTVCKCARLMALSTPPYTVVHANAAFGHLTGLQSSNIIGKTLHNLLEKEEASEHSSLASYAASSATGCDTLMSIVQKQNKEASNENSEMAVKCQMKVTPIASFMRNPHVKPDLMVTHYAVDFAAVGYGPTSSTAPSNQRIVSQGNSPSNWGLHTTIVG